MVIPFNGEPRSHVKGYAMRYALSVILMLATAPVATACDIRGDEVATTTLDAFRRQHAGQFACSDTDAEAEAALRTTRHDLGEVKCIDRALLAKGSFTIANIEVSAIYTFFRGTLAAIGGTFAPRDFPALELAFRQKWGAPASEETHRYVNEIGGAFNGKELLWVKTRCVIGLNEVSANRSARSLLLISSPLMDRLIDLQQRTPPPAPDL